MGELYEPCPRLPKNIRQIGERDDIVRVYVEDYVNTYLKRLFPVGGQDLRAGLLLGNTEEHNSTPYLFIDGALEMEGITEEGEKIAFSEEAWKRAYQMMEEMFPKRTVQGWFLCGASGCQLSPLNYWKQHSQYFSGKNKLMYLNSGLEGEEAIYITSSDGFYKLRGHYIYYERNQMMQDYMVMRKDCQRVEAAGSDPVIRDFRRKMEQKKEIANDQSRTIHFLRGMCGCLAVLTLAGVVAAFNSAEKMKDMEAVMAAALPDASAAWEAGKTRLSSLRENAQKESSREEKERLSGVVVEEARGGIFPTVSKNTEDKLEEESLLPAENEAAQIQSGEGAESSLESKEAAISETEETLGQSEEASSAEELPSESVQESQETQEAVSDKAKPARQLEPKPGQSVYVVEEGETLYGICFKLYQNLSHVKEICEINGLEDVNMLEAGFRLILP